MKWGALSPYKRWAQNAFSPPPPKKKAGRKEEEAERKELEIINRRRKIKESRKQNKTNLE